MVGCDLHNKTMVLRHAVGLGPVCGRTFANNPSGRQAMIKWLHEFSPAKAGSRILFAYEASSEGFGLYDELRANGVECYVLAPTRIARSPKHARGKNDGRDALQLLELLRAHVLAGNALPSVWVPDLHTRDDRELVRMRQDLAQKTTAIKNQIQALLKRNELRRPDGTGRGWTHGYWDWIKDLSTAPAGGLGAGGRAALSSLLRQLVSIESEIETLDEQVLHLSRSDRYESKVKALRTVKGVGVLTAMVFLAELGDLTRFSNRRQLAAYLGLTPTSNESGEQSDRKGHITRQGPSRVRKVLCQAAWSLVRTDPRAKAIYASLAGQKTDKRGKLALVAIMRQMSIVMWHRVLDGGPPADRPGRFSRTSGAAAPASSPPESTGKAA
jgi:transposase